MAAANSWHRGITTWKERNEFLFKNEIMADCSFIVGTNKTKIPAHKYVLGGNSEEFYNLFYLMKTSDEIPIEDVSADIFTIFLEFLYTEKTTVTMENVGDLLKLAKRYSVDHFEIFCGDFLSENVNKETALSVLDKYSEYKMPKFVSKCMKLISQNHLLFETPSFLKISIETLTELLKSNDLNRFREITIFNGVNKWSENFCHENNQMINSENKRLAVGPALQFIRFPDMSFDEFTSCTLNTPILTTAECMQIYQFIGTGGKSRCMFSNETRQGGIKKADFVSNVFRDDSFSFDNDDDMYFFANKPINFFGFGMLGRTDKGLEEQNPESFTIKLLDDNNKIVLLETIVSIHHDGTPKIYDIFFEDSILLYPDVEYRIFIHRQIPAEFENYYFGSKFAKIEVGGVMFEVNNNYFFKSLIFNDE